jgi:hypothetical protein
MVRLLEKVIMILTVKEETEAPIGSKLSSINGWWYTEVSPYSSFKPQIRVYNRYGALIYLNISSLHRQHIFATCTANKLPRWSAAIARFLRPRNKDIE